MRCALADVAVALAIIMSAGAIVAPQERAALLDLYETCTGHLWVHQHNWLNGDPCEQAWYGVFCDPTNSTVLVLDTSPRFAFNLLDCVLPPSLGNLTNLTQLYLSNDLFHSRLHGELPDTLQQLKALRCFYVSHGELSGPIPSWIATLPVLQGLFMRHNSFSGELPDLSAAQYLEDVWFDTQSGDGLTGSIDWLGNMTYLTHVRISFPLHCAGLPLHIENNNFTGTLPAGLCALGKHCYATGNHFECPQAECCGVKSCSQTLDARAALSKSRRAHQPSPLPYACTRSQ